MTRVWRRRLALSILAILYVLSFSANFTSASHNKIDHQQQISLDYIGKPIIDGEEMEAAAVVRAKRQQQNKRQAASATTTNKPTTKPPATHVSTEGSTLPPAPSTTIGMNDIEIDNTTIPSSSPPPQSSSPLPPSQSPSISTTEIPASSSSPTRPTTEPTSPPPPPTTEPTSPPPPPTTEEPPPQVIPGEGHTKRSYFCLCDYQVKVCDMNCCCDPDCSEEDKTLFTGCTASLIYDSANQRNNDYSCLKSYMIYNQNTPYHIDRKDKSLLCIAKENVRQAREFSRSDMQKIAHRISHGKIGTRPKYTWDSLHQTSSSKDIKMTQEPYKYGSAIWYIKSENKDGEEVTSNPAMFRLPAPYFTDMCSILEPVKFLQNSVSRCVRPLHDAISQCKTLPELDANSYISYHSIILSSDSTEDNSTDYLQADILPVTECLHSTNNCKNLTADSSDEVITGFLQPDWSWTGLASRKCVNVLSQLNLTFIHEGIKGINQIIAKAVLVDVYPYQTEIVQEFNTEFVWDNSGKPEEDKDEKNSTTMEDFLHDRKLPRSGNPGYVEGKPLILGRKVQMKDSSKNDTEDKKHFVERMHVLPDVTQWLSIQGAGDCPLTSEEMKNSPRHPISFGYDHVSTCNLQLKPFRYCEDLQRHIAFVILGLTLTNKNENLDHFTLSPFHVAAYGSPDAFPADWVPLTAVKGSYRFPTSLFPTGTTYISTGCEAIMASIHITVSFAYVGPVDAPQAKITGVFYEPEEPIMIPSLVDTTPENQIKNIPVTTTVSFLDVTGRPTTRVATFPVVSVQLPTDFFYPFSSTSTRPSSGTNKSASSSYVIIVSSLIYMTFFRVFIV